jgi:hypothetical protein
VSPAVDLDGESVARNHARFPLPGSTENPVGCRHRTLDLGSTSWTFAVDERLSTLFDVDDRPSIAAA